MSTYQESHSDRTTEKNNDAFAGADHAMTALSASISTTSPTGRLAASEVSGQLPALAIHNDSDSAPEPHQTFLGELGHSFAYSAVQAPLEGVSQVIDHTIGKSINSHLYKASKDLVVKAPVAAEYGTAGWYGQSFGGALGVLPWFMLTRSGLRAAEGSIALTRGLVVDSAEAALNKSLVSQTGARLVLEGGLTGAAHAGLFQPVADDRNYWSAKTNAMGKSLVTFSTMTATSVGLGAELSPLAQKLAGQNALAQVLASKGSQAIIGAISAVPAASADVVYDYVTSGGKNRQTAAEFGKNIYSYAVVGAGLSVVPAFGEHASIQKTGESSGHSANIEMPFGNKAFSPQWNHVLLSQGIPMDKSFSKPASYELLGPVKNTAEMIKEPQVISVSELNQQLDHLPNVLEFSQLIAKRKVGALPEGLSTGDAKKDELVFSHLDALAQAVRSLDTSLPPQKKTGLGAEDLNLQPFKINLAGNQVEVSKIGVGEVSHVYKLSVAGHDYAFKVPNDAARMDVHGAMAETAAFTYLAKENISDLIDFHAANPSPQGGWLLTEYVSRPVERSGEKLADVLSRDGLQLGDDWSANRGPGHVVWDLGGIEPKNVKSPTTAEQFQDLLQTPEGKMIGGRKLNAITDQGQLKEALLTALQHPEIGGQVARTAVRNLHDIADINDVLSRALETKGAAGRAAFELDTMVGTVYIKDLFYKALHNPESRIEAAKMIDKLPQADRKAAFDAAFKYPEARAMATKSISSLPNESDRIQAASMAREYPGSNYVLYQELAKYRDLSADEKGKRDKALAHYLEGHGLYPVGRLDLYAGGASFDNWVKQHSSSDNLGAVGNYSNIREIWHDLTQSQQNLSPRELSLVAEEWSKLSSAQWKTLGSAEAVAFARSAKHLTMSESEKAFATPELRSRLSSLDDNENYWHAANLVKNWDSIPDKFRALETRDYIALNSAWPLLKPEQWAALPASEVSTVAQALSVTRHLDVERDTSPQFVEFAQWYGKNQSRLNHFDDREVSRVYQVWDKLSAEQKNLPVEQLLAKAKVVSALNKLEKIAGVSPKVIKYLSGLGADSDSLLLPLSKWLISSQWEGDEFIQKSVKKHLLQLVEAKASPEEFERSALERSAYMEKYFGANPELQAKLLAKVSGEDIDKLWLFVHRNPELNLKLLQMALSDDTIGSADDWKRLDDVSKLAFKLSINNEGDLAHLLKLHGWFKFGQLVDYLDERPNRVTSVRELVQQRAEARQLNPVRLLDEDYLSRLTSFNDAQREQLRTLHLQGLSIIRLANHIKNDPGRIATVEKMLEQGYDSQRINAVMRLSAFPDKTALAIEKSAHNGNVKVEDVVSKVRDFKAGSNFRSLLIQRVNKGEKVTTASIDRLFESASASNVRWPSRTLHRSKFAMDAVPTAETFVMAADSIMSSIPQSQPIVLLGRDAWPLVPLLRARGRDNVHYFLWSRLQNDDTRTHLQWLREIPPNAAVIDTGFRGTILDSIKKIDSTISGAMLSSTNSEYPSLLKVDDRSSRVNAIEEQTKLISRASAHTRNGGAIARKIHAGSDVDNDSSLEKQSVWYAQAGAREVLTAMGLPEWEAWRYSQFTGLTPQERLGLRSDADVEQHYNSVLAMRRQNGAANFTTSSRT